MVTKGGGMVSCLAFSNCPDSETCEQDIARRQIPVRTVEIIEHLTKFFFLTSGFK
jgi:hypothetical protein